VQHDRSVVNLDEKDIIKISLLAIEEYRQISANVNETNCFVFFKTLIKSSNLLRKTSTISNSLLIPCSKIINWNKSTNTENLKQSSLPLKTQISSESNLSELLI
jgi:hypothetical protein